jgi:4'-phosphopantetheinyl transferase
MIAEVTWSRASAGLQLNADGIHIWRAFLDVDPVIRNRLSTFLSKVELERAARFIFARDRDRFTVARGILRQLLGGYVGKPPRDVLLEKNAYGKPKLSSAARVPLLEFNASHSHGLALFAFCFDHEVGIDVEKVRTEVAFEKTEKHYLSPRERIELDALPLELRAEGFFLCWTRKESYVKARGEGLYGQLGSFDVSLRPGEPAVLKSPDKDRWSLYSLRPESGFVGALVAEGNKHRLQHWEWNESHVSLSRC